MFGNYAEFVGKESEKLDAAVEKATAKYEALGYTPAQIAKQLSGLLKRQSFYGDKNLDYNKKKQAFDKTIEIKEIEREKRRIEARNAQEAAFAGAGGNRAAQDAQRRADAATVAQANKDYSSGASYSGGESTPGDDTSYNDPFDPGGGEKDGGHIDGTNRRRYGTGGIVSL